MRAWNVAMSMAVCLAALVGWAEKVELRGTVVTWEGKVAAKAEVHLVRRTVEPWKSDLLASTTADEQGRFYLDGVELPGPEPRTFSVEVMSWTDGYSLGWCAPGAQHPANLKIELGKLGTFRGKVQDSAGKPVEGAIVGLGSLWRQLPGERFRSDYLLVPEDLGKRWAVQTDKDGGFRVPWAGENTRPSLFVAKDGYCRGNVNWKDSETEAGVVLYRSGAIRGQVRCAVANVSVAGYRVAYMAHQMLGQTSLIRSHGPAKNVTDAQGRFALEDVPPGQFRVYVAAEPTSEWQSGEGQDVELAEGQTKDNVTLELKRGAKVSGRVVDADTDAPIADVALYATGPVRRFSQPLPKTDAEGRYGFYGWPGSLELHVSRAPGNYIVPPAVVKRIEAQEGAELVVPDFRLKNGVAVDGLVVDEAGRPVAGAELTVARVTGQSHSAHSAPPTDAEGRFRLPAIDPATRLALAARKESAFTEPITVTAGQQKESLKLVLKTGTGAKVTGRIVDDQRKPIAGARVSAMPDWQAGRFIPGSGDSAVTGEEGRFEMTLWPSVGYSLNASAPNHKSATTSRWQTEPGKAHDLGDIVLQRLVGVLAGRVVDSKGLPVQGAMVWNTGDAEKRLEATTDSEGRFRLEGFEAGFAYVFAEKEGLRLTGQRSACPAEGLILILRRADEAVAVRKPMPAAEPDAAEMRRLALKALDIGLKQTEGQKSDSGKWRRTQLVGLLARVDPVPATELAAKEGGQDKGRFSMSDRVIVAMGRQALARSVEEAIAHFNQLADIESKAWAALDGARKLAKTSPAKAEALLAYALPAIHGVPNVPRQTVDLAIAAGLMLQLNMPRGHELLAEAAGKAKNFALTGWEAYARGVVAEQLCERDLEMAMALITPITDPIERPRHLENIAYRIAAKQPDRAKQLVDGIEQTWEREKALARLCHRLAGVDVGRAEAVAESIHERAETKARAYVWMAEQVADTDRQKAFAYLSGAVETVSQRAKATNYFDNVHSPSIVIALVARTAAKLGHPEAGAMLLQSLSLRPLPRALGASGHGEADARLAIALAAADATTAREFLEVLMPRTLALVRQRPKAGEIYRAGGIVADVALAALITAPSLFERYLEDVQKANGPVDAKRLAEYALGDAKEREDVVRQALHIPKPDEDW